MARCRPQYWKKVLIEGRRPRSGPRALPERLRPGGRVVLVEYDRRAHSRWVPYPIPIARLPEPAASAGLSVTTTIGCSRKAIARDTRSSPSRRTPSTRTMGSRSPPGKLLLLRKRNFGVTTWGAWPISRGRAAQENFNQLVEELGLSSPYEEIEYDNLTEEQQARIDRLNLAQLETAVARWAKAHPFA